MQKMVAVSIIPLVTMCFLDSCWNVRERRCVEVVKTVYRRIRVNAVLKNTKQTENKIGLMLCHTE